MDQASLFEKSNDELKAIILDNNSYNEDIRMMAIVELERRSPKVKVGSEKEESDIELFSKSSIII